VTIDQPRVPGIAGRSAAIGGGLGIAAGVAQTTIGRHIPDWSGNKAQPVALGLLTIALSASALATAGTLRATTKPGDGALTSIAIWLAAVAAVCASTVGRLWVIPGVLLLVAAGVTIAACGVRNVRAVVARNWLVGLLGVLGVFELVMAVSAPSVVTRVAGLLAGAALIAAALTATPGRRTLIAVLVAATLPFVALTWWTIVTPAVTVVAFAIGAAATSNRAHAAAPRLEWGPVRAADR
jgi:hypothetical protein